MIEKFILVIDGTYYYMGTSELVGHKFSSSLLLAMPINGDKTTDLMVDIMSKLGSNHLIERFPYSVPKEKKYVVHYDHIEVIGVKFITGA